jgi:hypothetical protein
MTVIGALSSNGLFHRPELYPVFTASTSPIRQQPAWHNVSHRYCELRGIHLIEAFDRSHRARRPYCVFR